MFELSALLLVIIPLELLLVNTILAESNNPENVTTYYSPAPPLSLCPYPCHPRPIAITYNPPPALPQQLSSPASFLPPANADYQPPPEYLPYSPPESYGYPNYAHPPPNPAIPDFPYYAHPPPYPAMPYFPWNYMYPPHEYSSACSLKQLTDKILLLCSTVCPLLLVLANCYWY